MFPYYPASSLALRVGGGQGGRGQRSIQAHCTCYRSFMAASENGHAHMGRHKLAIPVLHWGFIISLFSLYLASFHVFAGIFRASF